MTHHQLDDPMSLFSHYYYPGIYTQLVPNQGDDEDSRRRRRKNKGETSGSEVVMKKRKLSEEQVDFLERSFGEEQKLDTERKDKLAFELSLDPQQVAVWFQNKRARWKNKKLEEQYSKLKSEHNTMIVQKYHLEIEIEKMKKKLCEVENKIQRLLLERNYDGLISSNNSTISISSIFSMEQPHLNLGNFGMEEILMDYQNTCVTGQFDAQNILC